MAEVVGGAARADQLARRIARGTAAAWVVGVVVLTVLAVAVAAQGEGTELDGHLRAHAMAAYGLGYWDADGAFHGELLAKEVELLDPDVSLTIATPTGTAFGPVLGPNADLVADAMADGVEVVVTRGDRRLLALPAFDDADRLKGAVVASTSMAPSRATLHRLAAALGTLALGFCAMGLLVSRRLAARILRTLLESIEERERVLAGAAHELRNPLAALVALGSSPAPDALEQVASTAADAAELVDRLLVWSRLADAAPEVEPLRLDLLVEASLDEGEALDAEPVTISADPRLLRIAIDNLIRNARTHGGGIERVEVRGGTVSIQDRGTGIPDAALLAPFAKGRDSTGTGLGLALAVRIAEAHGGRLEPGPPVRLVLPLN